MNDPRARAIMSRPYRPVGLVNNGAFTEIVDEGTFFDNGDSLYETDFQQELEMRSRSEHIDGLPLDDLDAKFRLQELDRAAIDAKSPSVSLAPASWDRGVLGGIATAQPNPTSTLPGDLNQVVFWPGDDRESGPVTITLAPKPGVFQSPTTSLLPVSRSVARVNWGTKNGQFTADVDVGNGIEFSIEAASVYVSVYQDAGSTISQNLMASIGFYSATRTCTATRTAYLSILSGATENVIRPNFATTIIGFERYDSTAQYVLDMLDINGTLIGQRVVPPSAYLITPIVLPNDCYSIDVTNNGSLGDSRLIFGLF